MGNALRTAKLAKLTCELERHQNAPYCEELAWAIQSLGLEVASVSVPVVVKAPPVPLLVPKCWGIAR